MGGTILDIASLRAGSDLYGEPYGELVPLALLSFLKRDDWGRVSHLGERKTSSLVCHSSVDFSRYFLNGELAGRLGLFF